MEFLFELVGELFGELILPLLFEFVVEGGGVLFQGLAQALRRVHWALAALLFALLGALAGVASLALLPSLVLRQPASRAAYLALSPLVAGALAYGLAKLGRRGGESGARRSFVGWFCFALAYAIVRAGGVGFWGMLR